MYADGFGWKHPELHFMSWALSCLSLREHYDDVTLYTDSAGYDVLINKLRLPYTRVEVCFDNLKCRRAMRCNQSDLLRPGCAVRYNGVGTARFTTYFARMKVVNIHFPWREKRSGFFTRFCVFVVGCAKASIGDRKKYVRCILKYV